MILKVRIIALGAQVFILYDLLTFPALRSGDVYALGRELPRSSFPLHSNADGSREHDHNPRFSRFICLSSGRRYPETIQNFMDCTFGKL